MKKLFTAMLMALLLIPALSPAQQKETVALTSRAEVEVEKKGPTGEKLLVRVEASKANVTPGDTVIYSNDYVNNGDQPADNIVINNPIPEHMVYVDKSAEGVGTKIDFSVDKGKTYGTLAKLIIRTAAGRERPARPTDVTNVRWTLEKPLPAGGKGTVSYRSKVK